MNNTIYFLKTSPLCIHSCIYCGLLNKKNSSHKTARKISEELKIAKSRGFEQIKLSCNTDIREDFFEILELIKFYNFKIILETNGRKFCDKKFFQKTVSYINQYELYISFPGPKLYGDITEGPIEMGSAESFTGFKNIAKLCKNKKFVTAKIVIVGRNSEFLFYIIDKIKNLGINKIRFVLPFKQSKNDNVLSLAEAVFNVFDAEKYALEKGIEVVKNENLEYNPYLIEDFDFFDKNKAEVKLNLHIFKNKPKFSVIIPTFNKKESIKFVLESFFKQNYDRSGYEIIIVDDGSDDKTFELIKEIKPNCNLKYIYWPRKKIELKNQFKKWAKFYNRAGLARNIGVDNAAGEIILFNDADIIVDRDCLNKHEEYHNTHANIIVRGFRMFLPARFHPSTKKNRDTDLLNKISIPEKSERGKNLHCHMYNLTQWGWQRIITANISVRKKHFDKVRGFSKDFVFWGFEDVDLGYRLSKLKMKLMWDDKIKVYHLSHKKESEGEFNNLLAYWVGTNILYRKYLDFRIYDVYQEVILRKLDDAMVVKDEK